MPKKNRTSKGRDSLNLSVNSVVEVTPKSVKHSPSKSTGTNEHLVENTLVIASEIEPFLHNCQEIVNQFKRDWVSSFRRKSTLSADDEMKLLEYDNFAEIAEKYINDLKDINTNIEQKFEMMMKIKDFVMENQSRYSKKMLDKLLENVAIVQWLVSNFNEYLRQVTENVFDLVLLDQSCKETERLWFCTDWIGMTLSRIAANK